MPLRNSLATILPRSLKSAGEFGFQPGKCRRPSLLSLVNAVNGVVVRVRPAGCSGTNPIYTAVLVPPLLREAFLGFGH